jgi:hypothetical protein
MTRPFFLTLTILVVFCNVLSESLRPTTPISRSCGVVKVKGINIRRVARPSFALRSVEQSTDEDLHQKINSADFDGAIQLLKRNPMLHLNTEDARLLLNNLEALTKDDSEQKDDGDKKVLQAQVRLNYILFCSFYTLLR